MLRMTAFVFAAVLLGFGCSAHTPRDSSTRGAVSSTSAATASMAARLDGTRWRFVKVAGTPVPAAVVATVRFENGHVSGKAGCNAYGASYQAAADGGVSFSQILSTQMACLAPAGSTQVERRVFAAFPRVAKAELQDGDLLLLDAKDHPLARLKPAVGPDLAR